MPRSILLLAVLPLLLASCALLGNDGGDNLIELAQQRRQWERQGYDAYEYELNIGCFCPYFGPARLHVRADTVADLSLLLPPDVPPPTEAERRRYMLTVENLFGVIAEAIQEGADELEVEYHETLGYPTRISIDYYKNALDDEVGYTVSYLNPLR